MDRMILDTRLRRPSCALLTQQTATAVVQQVSSAAVKQIPFAATRYLACRRTSKRRPSDNQSCGQGCAAPTVKLWGKVILA